MKHFLSLGLLFAAAWAAPIDSRDEDCEMVWVTVYGDAPISTASMPPFPTTTAGSDDQNAALGQGSSSLLSGSASAPSGSTSNSSTTANSPSTNGSTTANSPGTNGISTTNTDGLPGIPLDGPHLSAPVSDAAVPSDAKVYTPPSKSFSGKAFETWMKAQAETKPASKWLKVAPGVYDLSLKDNIVISFMDGVTEGWTIDFRGVTFVVDGAGQAIYINQAEDLTIYGGTVWFDQGELWTQAKITAITDIGGGLSSVTAVVDDLYNLTTWRNAGPRNLNAMDTSDADHYVRPKGLNFWYAKDFAFDNLDSKRTFTFQITTKNVGLKVGWYLTMENGLYSGGTIASENNSNLKINGFTSNGGFAQYGLGSKTTATVENVWNVNAPNRPGMAPRVEGPTMSEGHIQWFDYDTPGQPAIVYQNSWWMTTGGTKDLQTMSDQTLHDGGY